MSPNKTSVAAKTILAACVAKFSWSDGPWSLPHLMSSHFPIGASLNSRFVDEWAKLNVQTPRGQTLALEIGSAYFAKTGKKIDAGEE